MLAKRIKTLPDSVYVYFYGIHVCLHCAYICLHNFNHMFLTRSYPKQDGEILSLLLVEDVVSWTRRIGADLIELARALGQPRLAGMVSAAFAEAEVEAEKVPAELRATDGSRHLKLVVPLSGRGGDQPAQPLDQGGGMR